MVTTAGQGQRSGIACWKWAKSRAHASHEPRERPGHAQLLAPCAELESLDSVRDQLGMACDGNERELVRERRQLAKEVRDVRLLARALAAEDVGIHQDERTHASLPIDVHGLFRHPVPAEAGGTFPPEPSELLAAADRLFEAGRDRGGIGGIDEYRRAVCDLLGRAAPARHDRRAAGHRLEHGQPETLVQRRVGDAERSAVERGQLGIGDVPEPANAGAVRLDAAPAARADDPQLEARTARTPPPAARRFLRGSSVPTART